MDYEWPDEKEEEGPPRETRGNRDECGLSTSVMINIITRASETIRSHYLTECLINARSELWRESLAAVSVFRVEFIALKYIK